MALSVAVGVSDVVCKHEHQCVLQACLPWGICIVDIVAVFRQHRAQIQYAVRGVVLVIVAIGCREG